MNDAKTVGDAHVERAPSASPGWWLIMWRELADAWVGGKSLILILLFSILQGMSAYVFASNSELSLIPPKEMVFLTLQTAIATGLFVSLIIGADSISGERERATLETLLLAPTSRRQIVFGKFLAAISAWPVAMLITTPFLYVLSQRDMEAFNEAMIGGSILGSFLALGFTAFGMLISLWSNSNRTSLFVSLIVYLICLLPTQFPGTAQTGTMGRMLKRINPMESVNQYLEKTIVNNRTLAEYWDWLAAPVIFVVVTLIVLFWAAPTLRLEGGKGIKLRLPWKRGAPNASRPCRGCNHAGGRSHDLRCEPCTCEADRRPRCRCRAAATRYRHQHGARGRKKWRSGVLRHHGYEQRQQPVVAVDRRDEHHQRVG